MTRSHRRTATLASVAIAGALTLAGCSGADDGDAVSGSADRGIDASHYADSYAEQQQDSGTYSSSSSAGSVAPTAPGSPQLLEDNTFVDHGVGGYVDTGEDAESTFALDVDTGSFSVARTLLAQGVRPPAASVRVEEWVNSFDYDDPAPEDDALGVTTETGPRPGAVDGTQLVRVAVSSREATRRSAPART